MRRVFRAAGLVAAALTVASPVAAAPNNGPSVETIKEMIIRQSIARYPGTCACPYSTMRNGRSCGRRSAYSRPGGYAPKCYPSDVTAEEVKAYRATLVRQ
ncbi:hypothetical protein [Pedomonas sp. V897]|uniref:hypothetical protein n=1 Tax=Pedomonas sp. V897 TaxID=3446482 RepID=UPI003EE41E62